jgi:NAD(P)-dependent dehydrogenase (short-subunit alcohol dehydrogenase family)
MDNPFLTLPPVPTYPDLRRKVVLITGIGQVGSPSLAIWGNGAATACAFARQGCKIFGCDLNLDAAENTQKRIVQELSAMGFNKASLDITVTKCDVTTEAEVKDMVQKCIEKYERIDVLIK